MATVEKSNSGRTDAAVGLMSALGRFGQSLSRRGKSGAFSAAPRFIELILIGLLGLLAARLFWLLLAPLPVADTAAPVVRPVAANSPTAAKSPFGKIAAAEPAEPAEQPLENVQETSLNLKLHGVYSDSENSSAIIETPENKQKVFNLGDEIWNGVTLEAVYPNQVTINSNGVIESLKLPKELQDRPPPIVAPANRPPAPQIREVDGPSSASLRGASRNKPRGISEIVRFEPSRNSEGETAIAIYSVGDKAFFASQGLRDGDVVVAVDNKRVTNVVEALTGLANKPSVKVNVERNGVPVELVIALNPERGSADASN